MMLMTRFAIGLGILLFLAGVSPAHAQLSAQGGPMQIDGNVTEILNKENKVIFSDGVDVVQGDTRMRADKMTIIFGDDESNAITLNSAFGDIEEIVAEGDVFFITPDQKARGDEAVYSAELNTIVLSGNVVVTIGSDVARTDCLTIDRENDTTRLGCNPGTTTVVITPKEDGEDLPEAPEE
ncbi:MAG: LptA/OstA family protein [Pseudomonadota bacterium]